MIDKNLQDTMERSTLDTTFVSTVNPTAIEQKYKSPLHMVCAEHELKSEIRFMFLHQFRQTCSSSEDAAIKLIDADCHLYTAVYTKDAKVVEYMLRNGFSTSSTTPKKITPLHVAVELEDVELVTVLLNFGAKVEALDHEGYSPLFYVYRFDKKHSVEKVQILRLLLSRSASLMNAKQVKHTLRNGDAESVQVVLSKFVEREWKDTSVLHSLAVNWNPGVIDELKIHFHKCNVNELEAGLSPLQMASIHGNVEMLKFLLKNRADVNYADRIFRRTALYYAFARSTPSFQQQYDECIEILLQNGADPQFIAFGDRVKKVTVFENKREKLEPVIAQLALLEEIGTTITEVTREKIDSNCVLKEHYDNCRRVLGEEIDGNVTLLKVLTVSERILEKYAGNEELVSKLERICDELKVKFTYYSNTLTKRFSKAIQRRKLTDTAAVVLCNIFENCVDAKHIVIGRVCEYLSDEDLWQLCQL